MNLHDYFEQKKTLSLDPTRKMELYEKIVHQTYAPVSIFARFSFYTKVALYTFVGLIFLASLYIPYFSSLFQQTDGVITTSLGGATVQADYIAQIIETKGDIAIYNNGEKVESSLFRAGDRLVLPPGGEIVFHVTTIAQAKVIGPAEFIVEKNHHGYSIHLISGKYAEIQSLSGSTDSGEALGFKSARISIRPKKAEKVHFTYTEQGEAAIIDNQGDTELVVAQTNDVAQEEVLGTHTMASVASAESGALVLDTIRATGDNILTPVQVAKALSDAPHQLADEKHMISGTEHENIKAILAAEFLSIDLQKFTTSYLKGTQRDYDIAYTNLYNKINQIYIIMNIPVPQYIIDARVTGSVKVLIAMIENLLTEMDNNFYIAQSHPTRLKKVLGWLYALGDENFGSMSGSKLSGTDLLETLDLSEYKELTN